MIREKAPIFLEISKNLGDLCATPPSTIINRNERLHIAVFVKMPDIYIYISRAIPAGGLPPSFYSGAGAGPGDSWGSHERVHQSAGAHRTQTQLVRLFPTYNSDVLWMQ